MIEMHLYGQLRRFSNNQDPTGDSIINTPFQKGDTIEDIIRRSDIPPEAVSSNIFLNGQYSTLERAVKDGDRLGLFPNDMQLLMV